MIVTSNIWQITLERRSTTLLSNSNLPGRTSRNGWTSWSSLLRKRCSMRYRRLVNSLRKYVSISSLSPTPQKMIHPPWCLRRYGYQGEVTNEADETWSRLKITKQLCWFDFALQPMWVTTSGAWIIASLCGAPFQLRIEDLLWASWAQLWYVATATLNTVLLWRASPKQLRFRIVLIERYMSSSTNSC